jgi:hypothetical protein
VIYQFLWTAQDEASFEQAVPLLWHGEHLRANGWGNPITLCFLAGLEKLSSGYRARLEALGYRIVDGAPLVAELVGRYPRSAQLSMTSRFWFLRWNVLRRLSAEQGAQTVVHLDGDVVLLADPDRILREVAGRTFMLQGCPAFTAISDPGWFDVWERELALLLEDRPTYLAQALREKLQPQRPDREFCNVCAYSGHHFEDQDLLEYLVAAGKLPQATSRKVFDSPYYWMQNPLLPSDWHEAQAAGTPKRVVERDGVAYVGDKQLVLYHFQTYFAKYCRVWPHFERLGLGGLAASLRAGATDRSTSKLLEWSGRLLDRAQRTVDRRAIYQKVFQVNPATGNRLITDIVNSCWE